MNVTKHTSPLDIAAAVYKGKELNVSPSFQETQARIDAAAEILYASSSKLDAAKKLMDTFHCSLSNAYYYITKAQQQDPELDQSTRKWFVWMVLEHAMDLMHRLKDTKKNHKEEVALVKTLSDLIDKHMSNKEAIDWSKVQLPEIIVLQSMPEQVKSQWQGKSDAEIQKELVKILKLDENPEEHGNDDIEDIDFTEY